MRFSLVPFALVLLHLTAYASPTDSTGASQDIAVSSATAPTPILRRSVGVVETVDLSQHRLTLKTKNGTLIPFTVGPHSRLLRHHRRIDLSTIRPSERVIIRFQDGSTEIRTLKVWPSTPTPH